jgi:hypothetical protein
LAGSLIAAFGPPAYFATLATLTGALTIYDLWRKSRRSPVPAEKKGPFITAQPQGMAGQILGTVSATPLQPGVSPHEMRAAASRASERALNDRA